MSLRRCFLTLLLPLAGLAAAAQALNDGPHVFWEGREARVVSVKDGKVVEKKLPLNGMLGLSGLPSMQLGLTAYTPKPSELPFATRIVAVSDIHGNAAGLRSLLRAHGVMDEHQRWAFGAGHLVVVGDVADRGADVTEAYWLIRSLEQQAAGRGGGVHFLLGNHEVMVMQGDTRYAHPKYQQQLSALLGRDMTGLTAPDTELGRWLRVQPVVIRIRDFLFVHGGISPQVLGRHQDVESLNQAFRKELSSAQKGELLAGAGPLWYRGLIPGMEKKQPEATLKDVDAILKGFKVKAIVVGHSTLEHVTPFHGGKVYGIDADLKSGKAGEAWIFEDGKVFRGLPDGSRVALEPEALPKAAGL